MQNNTSKLIFFVFLNGLLLMVLEMSGARLLAPWLGTSVVVWTSIIGVILACLSLGHYLGGILSDTVFNKKSSQHPSVQLSRIFLLASASTLLCIILSRPILSYFSRSSLSLYVSALCTTILLFGLPSMFCGMVSPYCTRLCISQNSASGKIIGQMNATGTIGSILGTFLGGFVLISFFSTTTILFSISVCFFVASIVATRKDWKRKILFFIAICFTGSFLYLQNISLQRTGATLITSPYNTIQIQNGVIDNEAVVLLQTDPGSGYQSASLISNPAKLLFSYTHFYQLGTHTVPTATKILMLGGGGYSIPKWLLAGKSGLQTSDFTLDVVEIDPIITKVAHEYFDAPIQDSRMHIYHEDARMFLNRAPQSKKYDLIFGDVFTSAYTIPFHLGTVEAASLINDVLHNDGLFIMNIVSAIEGDKGELFRSIYSAFAMVFPTLEVYPVQVPHDSMVVQNIILVASKKAEPPFASRHSALVDLLKNKWEKKISPSPAALTDNFAPVEKYTVNIFE